MELGALKKFVSTLILSFEKFAFIWLSLRSIISFPSSATFRFSSRREFFIFDFAREVVTILSQSSLGFFFCELMIATGFDHCGMQRFIAIGCQMRDQVSHPVWLMRIFIRHNRVRAPAIFFFYVERRCENYTDRNLIIHIYKIHLLRPHFIPNGRDRL